MSGFIKCVSRVSSRAASSRTSIAASAPTGLLRSLVRPVNRMEPSLVRAAASPSFSRSLSGDCHDTTNRRIDIDPEVIYEYSSQSNPAIPGVPIRVLSAEHHKTGASRVTPFDLSADLGTAYPATSPNLLTSFIRVVRGEQLTTTARATSQGFYVIRGQGRSVIRKEGSERTIDWLLAEGRPLRSAVQRGPEHRAPLRRRGCGARRRGALLDT